MKTVNSDVNRDEILHAIHKEVIDWRAWTGRLLVMVFAALAGLTVVAFTWMTELAFGAFEHVQRLYWWSPLLWTPLCTAAIVWVMRRYAIGSAGSGIPQVMAALDGSVSRPTAACLCRSSSASPKWRWPPGACWRGCRSGAKARRCRLRPVSCTMPGAGCRTNRRCPSTA